MAPRIIPVEPFDIVVFGGTGDLAQRKLLPSLFWRFSDGQMPESSRVFGASRRILEDDAYRQMIREAIEEHVDAELRNDETLEKFLQLLRYIPLDATNDAGWPDLAEALGKDQERPRVFYLATSPELFGPLSASARRRWSGDRGGPGRAGEADRPRSRLGPRDQRRGRRGLRRAADLPDRPLSREGDRPEPHGAALRQLAVRADLEPRRHRSRPDHRRRRASASRVAAPTTTMPGRCGTWCRTTCCSSSAWSPWSRPTP